jgi:hypothetical protein
MFIVFVNLKFCTFLCVYGLFHILLSCGKIMDPWNVCMYICMYVLGFETLYLNETGRKTPVHKPILEICPDSLQFSKHLNTFFL